MFKKLKTNIIAGIIILLVAVVFACVIGPMRSINGLASDVEKKFSAASSDYADIDDSLSKLVSQARSLASIYMKLNSDNDTYKTYMSAIDKLDSVKSPFDAESSYKKIESLSYQIYYGLQIEDDASQDARSAKAYYYEITSTIDRMSRNEEYNEAARKYNEAVEHFPGSIFSKGKAVVFN